MLKIGITVGPSKKQFFINQAYINYIDSAGFEPVMIHPLNNPETMVSVCDGLVLPGGIDIDPVYYNEDNLASYGVNPRKDAFERQIFHAFLKAKKPVFGICRGFQLIARELLNSTLLSEEEGKRVTFWQNINKHRHTEDFDVDRDIPTHNVDINRQLLYNNTGRSWTYVNSIHHQCVSISVKKVAENLSAIGHLIPLAVTKLGMAKGKGYCLEAFDLPVWNARAVQWHPEELKDVGLLKTFFGDGKAKPVTEIPVLPTIEVEIAPAAKKGVKEHGSTKHE